MPDSLNDALKASPNSNVPEAEPPRTSWRRFTAFYARLLEFLLACCVGVLIIPVTLQVLARYTPLVPNYIWTEEMARFLFVWTIMVGAMVGIRDATHFEVDLWPRLRPRAEAAVRIVSKIGVLAMAAVFVWAGIEFTRFAWNRTSELGDLPLWWIHVAWPIAGGTWIVFAAEQMYDDFRVLLGRDTGASQS